MCALSRAFTALTALGTTALTALVPLSPPPALAAPGTGLSPSANRAPAPAPPSAADSAPVRARGSTPGTAGRTCETPPTHRIAQVQGGGDTSPLAGQTVRVAGVVTGDF